jgi:hypothetical protein
MSCFTAVLRTKAKQPLSTERLQTVRGMTSLVMSAKEQSVRKGTENDAVVNQPRGIVSKLIRANLLSKNCEVRRVSMPGKSMKRSALFNVSFPDLSIRQTKIEDYIDNNLDKFPATGKECLALLFEMIAHAYVAEPEKIEEDAMLRGLCAAMGDPAVFKALQKGAARPLLTVINLLQGNNG